MPSGPGAAKGRTNVIADRTSSARSSGHGNGEGGVEGGAEAGASCTGEGGLDDGEEMGRKSAISSSGALTYVPSPFLSGGVVEGDADPSLRLTTIHSVFSDTSATSRSSHSLASRRIIAFRRFRATFTARRASCASSTRSPRRAAATRTRCARLAARRASALAVMRTWCGGPRAATGGQARRATADPPPREGGRALLSSVRQRLRRAGAAGAAAGRAEQ